MDLILLFIGLVLVVARTPVRISSGRQLIPPRSSEVGGLMIVGYLAIKYLPLFVALSEGQHAWLSALLPLAAIGIVLLFATPHPKRVTFLGPIPKRSSAEKAIHFLGWGLLAAVFFGFLVGILAINSAPVGPDGIPPFLFAEKLVSLS